MDFRLPTIAELALITLVVALSSLSLGYSYLFEARTTVSGQLKTIHERVSSGHKAAVYELFIKTEDGTVQLNLSKSTVSEKVIHRLSNGAHIRSLATSDLFGREIYFAESLHADNVPLLQYDLTNKISLLKPFRIAGWLFFAISLLLTLVWKFRNVT